MAFLQRTHDGHAVSGDEPRTLKQNNALHLYARQLAEEMDNADLDMRLVIRFRIKPTKKNVWSEIIHPVMKALYPDRESTAELTKEEVTELYEVINKNTAEKLGISVPFPCKEKLI